MFRSAQHDRGGRRFNESLSFQHKRKIDAFAFGDIKAAARKDLPVGGTIREKRTGNRRWEDDKPRTWLNHEFRSATSVQRRKKTFHARAKIPHQTWLLEFHRRKVHVRLQLR